MRVLVTGASGLVGGRLIPCLLESAGTRVRAASRRQRNWPAGVEPWVTDYAEPSTFSAACAGMDVVINLASMSERDCLHAPHAALQVNAGGALAWSSAAVAAGVRRFVQVSTYKVYGNNPSGFVTEETPSAPQSHYAITHRVAEDYAQAQHPNSVVFRLANGFGAPVEAGTDSWAIIVNELCRQAVIEKQITIRSSGQAWRNFVPMRHVVLALRAAAVDLPSGLYHLGAAESMTLRALAQRVATICFDTLGFLPPIRTGAIPPDERFVPLDYRIDKLTAAGVTYAPVFDDELRETLLAAQQGIQ